MSSWKKAGKAAQKTHRERHQPEERAHLGLLPKKKDYVVRAKHYNANKETLKLLHKRALNKNPDEFYFHMINSKVIDGVHREKRKSEKHTPEQIKLMQTQDLKYITYKRNIEAKQVEKMQSRLHMIDLANEVKNKHTFFIDDDEKEGFDLAKKLNTHPSLLNRRTNRPTLDMLKKMKLSDLDEKEKEKIEQQNHMAYKEFSKRLHREHELSVVEQKLLMNRMLKDKNASRPKMVQPATQDSAPIYKWKYQRKR